MACEQLGNKVDVTGSPRVLRKKLIFMEGLPSASQCAMGIVLISAQRNLMRGARLVVHDVAHRIRVHSLLCPTLTTELTTTLPLFMCPGAAHLAEGGSQLKSVCVWPWGPPRCWPSPAESEWPRTASVPSTPLGQDGQQNSRPTGAAGWERPSSQIGGTLVWKEKRGNTFS